MAALAAGRETDGLRLIMADAMINEDAAKKHFAGYKWVPGLKVPRIALRFGAGVHYTASRGFSGDPKPVGTTQKIPEKRRRNRSGSGGFDPGGFDGPGAPGDGFGGGPGGQGGPGFGGPGGPGGQGGNSNLAKYAGEVGTKIVERLSERAKRGHYGQILTSSTAGRGRGATVLAGGLTDVGVGASKELLDKAKKQDLDILFLFSVTNSKAKNGITINNTVVELYNVATGQKLRADDKVAPKITLSNMKVQMDRKKGVRDGRDPVDTSVNKIFTYLDESFKGQSMPILKPEHAAKRVESLLKSKIDNPLPALAEIKYYYMRQWIKPADYGKAATSILGKDEAISMAKGTLAERREVFAEWLPKANAGRQQGNFAGGGGGFQGGPGGFEGGPPGGFQGGPPGGFQGGPPGGFQGGPPRPGRN